MQPFCWDAPALEQLQHPAIVDGALKQQVSNARLPLQQPLPPHCCTLPGCVRVSVCVCVTLSMHRLQERLRALFPELSAPGAPGQCSWLAWAFACVRSRSIKWVSFAGGVLLQL